MQKTINTWDDNADEYVRYLAKREPPRLDDDGIMSRMFRLLGDVHGRTVLDAGCGEGLLARVLAEQGAEVTGIDLSPRMIEIAREKDVGKAIDYRLADLSQPQPELIDRFDLIGSYLVLNDVQTYRGFASTLAASVKPGGRIVLAFNNPYSSVVREHLGDYFASGTICKYPGMWEQGVKAKYFHRTLEEYIDAFIDSGLRLAKLVDVADVFGLPWILPKESRFPRFMILAFDKP